MRRHVPHVIVLALALVLASCTGAGSADPTSPPTTSAEPSPTSPAASEPPLPTPTPVPTEAAPTTSTATPSVPSPTPTFTGGIDPPTEPPEGFSEFSVPPPDALTQEYAAWVLAEIYRAEDELIRMAVDAPDEVLDDLPDDFTTRLKSTYGGNILEVSRETFATAIAQPAEEEPFETDPGATSLSHIELLDANQDCLIIRYVEDPQEILRSPLPPRQMVTLLQNKASIDASSFNASPWVMVNRAPSQDVSGSSCP